MEQLRRVTSAALGRSNDVSHMTFADEDGVGVAEASSGLAEASPGSTARHSRHSNISRRSFSNPPSSRQVSGESPSPRREKTPHFSSHPFGVVRLGTGRRHSRGRKMSESSVLSFTKDFTASSCPSDMSSEYSASIRSQRTIPSSHPKYAALKSAFAMIDTDNSGWISAAELMDLLHFRGVAIKYYQALDVIKMYSSNDSDEISFKDFVQVMHDFEGAEVIDLTRAFGNYAAVKAQALERNLGGKSHGTISRIPSHQMGDEQNARLAFASIVDGPYVHAIVFVLIIVDVFCVIAELLLVVTWCEDPDAPSHRRLGLLGRDLEFLDWIPAEGELQFRRLAGSSTDSNSTTPWCSDCADRQHDWEVVLHTISISILCVFAGQIFLVMLAYRLQFFKNVFFVLDAVVVGGALILELAFHVKEGALLVVLLTWRLGRIVHGLVTTVEIGHKRMHHRINQVLRTQLLTKVEGMKELKSRITDLSVAEKDITKMRKLLEPTDMTIDNVETASIEILRRNCKLQMLNNQEVLETLTDLAQELHKLEEHIKLEMEDAHVAASRLDHAHHHKGDHKAPLRESADTNGYDDLARSPSTIEENPKPPSGIPEELPVEHQMTDAVEHQRTDKRRNTVT